MKHQTKQLSPNKESEKGSAMVMALLVSFLLLTASAGLLMETSKNTSNVTDVIAEQQAYNAAESGIQAAAHVLRCQKNDSPGCAHIVANPLLDPSKPATDPANQINYIKALNPAWSNAAGDTTGIARLSRWMTYNNLGATGRVPLDSNGPPYTANNGYAYSLAISDPDNTGSYVSIAITGKLFDADFGSTTQKTYSSTDPVTGLTTGSIRIRYTPPPALAYWDLGAGPLPSPYFGTFTVSRPTIAGLPLGNPGATITAMNRFEITIRMTTPYVATKTMRGWIRTTSNPSENPRIIFDSQTLTLVGSAMSLNFTSTTWLTPQICPSITDPSFCTDGLPSGSQIIGYQGRTIQGDNIIAGTITPPEPVRLLLKSTGYGPRGARKELQAIIQKNFFNGLTAPAALTLVGPSQTDDPITNFYFAPGPSAAVTYSGVDQVSTDIIPPIGTTDPNNLDVIENYLHDGGQNPFNGNIHGTPSNVNSETPYWLQSPANLDAEMQRLAMTARPYRFFPSGVTPTSFGDNATGQGITFCDGDVTFTGAGGGILVVTGKLTLHGSFNFRGLIIVTGRGGLERSGGGSGEITGNVIVAPYVSSRIEDTSPVGSTFLAPQYHTSGGGNSTLVYNSESVQNGLLAISNFVLGVMEK